MTDLYITPCIGICKIEDGICIGCKRTQTEIDKWNTYDYQQKMIVMRRLGYGRRNTRSKTKEKRRK